jgi:hypothetical protein
VRSFFFVALWSAVAGAAMSASAHAAVCGTPFSGASKPLARDSLYILQSAVGGQPCTYGLCDANSDCRVTAGDALAVLKTAVGLPAKLTCNPLCAPAIPCGNAAAPVCDGLCQAGYACTTSDAAGLEPDWRVTVCHAGDTSDDSMTVAAASAPDLLHGEDTLGPCIGTAEAAAVNESAAAVGGAAGSGAASTASEGEAVASAEEGASFSAAPCSCQPIVIATTTTTTSTSTTNTLPPPPAADVDNDGIVDAEDPCPTEARNLCAGPVATDATTGLPIRINANANPKYECAGDRVDCNGDTWHGDFGYNLFIANAACNITVDGQYCPIRNLTAIFGCEDAATEDLLQCEHFDRAEAPDLFYSLNVPDGTYVVNLFFANTYKRTRIAGKRIFDIAIEGEVRYPGFDQIAVAGGSRVALVRSAVVTVSDGNGLQIEFGHVVENPSVKAIEVLVAPPVATTLPAPTTTTLPEVSTTTTLPDATTTLAEATTTTLPAVTTTTAPAASTTTLPTPTTTTLP